MLNREDIKGIRERAELAGHWNCYHECNLAQQDRAQLLSHVEELEERLRKAERHMQLDLDALEVASGNYGMPCSQAITRLKEALAELSPSHDE